MTLQGLVYVTGPAKAGHVGTSYTLSLYRLLEQNICIMELASYSQLNAYQQLKIAL